jgi:hypothetical protein
MHANLDAVEMVYVEHELMKQAVVHSDQLVASAAKEVDVVDAVAEGYWVEKHPARTE